MELPSIHDPRFVEKMQTVREDCEADDAWFDLLAKWRAHRGEAIMTDWAWWWADEGENEFNGCCPTRDAAIAEAMAEGCFFGTDAFEIVEARSWTDELADDDFVPFADTRGGETLMTETDDDGVRRLAADPAQAGLFEGAE